MALPTVLGICYFPALLVLPFYSWRDLPRSHPKTIWRRMVVSTAATALFAWVPTWLTLPPGDRQLRQLLALLGLRAAGLPAALALPLALTAALFAGPLYQLALDWRAGILPSSRIPAGPAALRNLVVAPLTEEFLFRGCLISFLLARGASPRVCIFLSPLTFGAAHLHHLHDLVVFERWPLRHALLVVLFQLGYTTVFGWYAAFLLLRTGSLAALVVVHAFCNFMGFPKLGAIAHARRPAWMLLAYGAGVAAFVLLLRPLTEPGVFGWPLGEGYVGLFERQGS